MFIESFQGQYKDGTNGTHDFRMVSAVFLILRILIMASFLNRHNSAWPLSEVRCVVLVTAACLYAVLKPYRSNWKNNIDFMILILLEIVSLVFLTATYHPATATFTLCIVIAVLLIGIPHLVLIFYICYKFAKEAGITQFLKRKYRTLKTSYKMHDAS